MDRRKLLLQLLLLFSSIYLIVFGFNTLDWLFNTPIKAWEYLEILPEHFILAWNAYILAVLSLISGGILLGIFLEAIHW